MKLRVVSVTQTDYDAIKDLTDSRLHPLLSVIISGRGNDFIHFVFRITESDIKIAKSYFVGEKDQLVTLSLRETIDFCKENARENVPYEYRYLANALIMFLERFKYATFVHKQILKDKTFICR